MSSDIARATIAADIPLLLWGPPGIGKTARVQAWAWEAIDARYF